MQIKKQSIKVSYEVLRGKIAVDEAKVNCPLYFIARNNDLIIAPEIVKRIADKYQSSINFLDGNHHIFSDSGPICKIIHKDIKNIEAGL